MPTNPNTTNPTWIPIAQLCVALIICVMGILGSLLNSWWQHKLTLARENPSKNQVKAQNAPQTRLSEYTRVQISTFVCGILIPLAMLIYSLQKTNAITRSEVLLISVCVFSIPSAVMAMLVTAFIQTLATKFQSKQLPSDVQSAN